MQPLSIIFLSLLLLKISVAQDLNAILEETDNFFNSLIQTYENIKLNDKTKILINQKIDQYFKMTLEQVVQEEILKFEVDKSEARIFNGIEQTLHWDSLDVKDINFFKIFNGYNYQWFETTMTSTNVIVYTLFDSRFVPVAVYPMTNANKILTMKFNDNTLLIVQKSNSVSILSFLQQDRNFVIREIKNIDVFNVKDVSIWRSTNQLFLGISCPFKVYLFLWLGENFQLLQTLPFGSESLAFFHVDDLDLLVTSGPRRAIILKYAPRARRFVSMQTIQRSFLSAAIVRLGDEFSKEHIIALSGSTRTILYKLTDVLVPFQEIAPSDKVISISREGTSILLLIKDKIVSTYQYDGWRFVRLNYQFAEVEDLKLVHFNGEEQLLVKKINTCSLNRISWIGAQRPDSLLNGIKEWCLAAQEKAQWIPNPVPQIATPIRVSKANIQKLKVTSVNEISVEKIENLIRKYSELESKISVLNESLARTMSVDSPRFTDLRVKNARVRCTGECTAKNLATKVKCNLASRLRRVDDETKTMRFESVRVDRLDGFPCPSAGLKLDHVKVHGSINGMSFEDLEKDVLRTDGNQVVTAEHIFEELRADSVIASNIEAASGHTRQKVRTDSVHASELILTDGAGLLLPLDGDPVTISGTLTVSRAKIGGLINLRGGLRGRNVKKYAPMVSFSGFHELTGDYAFNDVRVLRLLAAKDVVRREGRSLKDIADNAIPLDGNVPVRLNFYSDRTLWTNITVPNLPNWLTRKNSQMVKVTGKKIALKNVTMPDSLFSKLPIPKIESRTCTTGAVASNIKTSTLRVGKATAKVVSSDNVYGAKELENELQDSVSSLMEVDLSRINFTGTVHVENLNISNFENSPFKSFQESVFEWYSPDLIKKSMKVKELKVGSLTALQGIKIPSPAEVRNAIVKGNLQVKRINGVNLDDFIKNIVRINESIHLNEVLFEGSIKVNEVETYDANFDLQNLEENVYFGNKTISGDLIIENDFWIPNILSFPPPDELNTYIIEGSIRFKEEPVVENINGENPNQLISKIWMLNRSANLTGMFTMKNITLLQDFDSLKLLQTPNFGSWASLENRLLSKTKLQEITVPIHFRTAKFPNIITRENATLHSSDRELNDLLTMTLKKNVNQTIRDKWHFDTLIVNDTLALYGNINKLNLSSDVARNDVEVNLVTGNKVVSELTVRNLQGLHFGEFVKDAMLLSNTKNLTTIKGKKTFNTLNARILNVNGTVMGKKLEQCLLKTGDQIILAPKIIKGSLQTPSLMVRGSINDLNVTKFFNHQVKKQDVIQNIQSKMIFKGDLQIVGNVLMKETFESIELSKIKEINEAYNPVMDTINYLKPFATNIETAMRHRAKYWDKFELVQDNISLLTPLLPLTINYTLRPDSLGNCILISLSELVCNENQRFTLKVFTNSTGIFINELISVQNVPIVIQISSGSRSKIVIYKYNLESQTINLSIIRAPGIIDAVLMSHRGIAWIAVRLQSHMMVVRYEPWGNLLKYHLTESHLLALDLVPATDELVLVRDDGMWKFEGLAGPRHVFKVFLRANKVQTFSTSREFFVRLIAKDNSTRLLRATYIGV